MPKALLALAPILLVAAPAVASSVPRVDMRPNGTAISGGIYDLDLDHAFGERLALGVNTNLMSVAARLTYRLGGTPGGACWGITLAGGPSVFPTLNAVPLPVGEVPVVHGATAFFQPAFVWAVPLNETVTARGTMGPVFFSQLNSQGTYRTLDSVVVPLWPNFELAFQMGWGEITLGGGIAGVRFNL
jgi:hypothetical protein